MDLVKKMLGLLQAQRVVLISLVEAAPDKRVLKSALEAHITNVQAAASRNPDDELLFETEAELERFIAVLDDLLAK